jgi:phosphonate transport system permease protein
VNTALRASDQHARRRPAWTWVSLFALGVLSLAAISALDWDLSALLDSASRAQAWQRLGQFLGAFGAPDLSSERLHQGITLSISTFSIALWGSGLGLVLGYYLALFASRAVWIGEQRPGLSFALRRVLLEVARLLLDALRGVPDFAWALLILTMPGPGAVTGVLAIALGVAGIIGKIFSELWDAIPERRYEALRSNGASRLQVFLYAIQPLSARSMLSFSLMRLECSVRNASVIGVVGGGGLGAQLFDEFNYGNYDGVVTLLLFLFALTAGTDLCSNFVRHQLRADPNHPRAARSDDVHRASRRRVYALSACLLAALGSAGAMRPDFFRALDALRGIDWDFISEQLSQVFSPPMTAAAWSEALGSCVVPLALGFLATALGALAAGLFAFPGSFAFQIDAPRFTGERPPAWLRGLRAALLLATRSLTLVLRSIPEVAWLLIFAAFFRIGILAGVLAVAVHSSGVLGRVFVESVDNLPYRPFEQSFQGSRPTTFLYAALPSVAREWGSYSFLQFEANLRAGLVVGIIGIGGLGERFHASVQSFNFPRVGLFLLTMVLLTTAVDRFSRAFKIGAGSVH